MRSHVGSVGPEVFGGGNSLIKLKGQDWLDKQRVAGRVAASTLRALSELVRDKSTKSLLELNAFAEQMIESQNSSCTFKNYKGFPAGVCISVNKQLVHGIPTDYVLQDGDVISFDLGVTFEGAIADTAITCIYGQPKSEQHVKLVEATEASLMAGIAAIKVGNRLGCIGEAIYKYGRQAGFSVVTKYGGHGLDWGVPHASPFVENRSDSSKGIRIQPGLVIAVEPMLVIGSPDTRTSDDGWTVTTNDIGAHFEHSLYVHEESVEILTDRSKL
jgi:methionyl aminopeptidase